MPVNRLRHRACLMLVTCTALWALSFPAMKMLALIQQPMLPKADSWLVTSLSVLVRFEVAGLLLLLFAWREIKTISRLEIEQGTLLAFFTAAGITLQMDGLAYTSASTSAFLTQFYCVLIPMWVALVARKWPSFKIIFCSALVLAGMAVLVNLDLHSLRLGRGEIETLLASVMFTAQILCLEHSRYAGNRPLCFTTVTLLGAGWFAIPLVVLSAPSAATCWRLYSSPAAVGLLAAITLLCTLVAFVLMSRWQRQVTATEAGLIYCAEPLFASALALFLPEIFSRWSGVAYANEQLTLRLILGGCLITVANVLLQSRWLDKPAPKLPDR